MAIEIKEQKDILPESGLWNLESLAVYLKTRPDTLQAALTEKGIKTLILGTRYNMRLVSLSAVAEYFKKAEK